MLKRSLARWIVLPVTLVAAGVLMGQSALAADSITARMDTFTSPDGVSSFALSLKPAAVARDDGRPRHRRVVQHVGESNGRISRQGDRCPEGFPGRFERRRPRSPGGGRSERHSVDARRLWRRTARRWRLRWPSSTPASPWAPPTCRKRSRRLSIVTAASRRTRGRRFTSATAAARRICSTPTSSRSCPGGWPTSRIPVSSYAVGGRLDQQLLGALAAQSGGTVIVESDTAGTRSGTFVGHRGRCDRALADVGHLARRNDRSLSQADAAVAERSRDDRAGDSEGKRPAEDST